MFNEEELITMYEEYVETHNNEFGWLPLDTFETFCKEIEAETNWDEVEE